MKRILLFSFMSLSIALGAMAQRTISGQVTTPEDGSGIPGVNVILKGTTTGTTTDLDGNYRLSVPEEGGTLVYSFVGLEPQELEIGARSVIDVAMTSDVQQLTEVVVTALGGDRNAREVVYANQTVDSEELLSTPSKNALEALRGKTAGVRLSTGSGSVGASTRIVLRGEGSLTGNNNALIVIDGIAIDNSTSTGGAETSTGGYADYGNRFNDINPDDIASLTILKGPSATSLYGSRGASGVILITTKKGSSDGGKSMKVSLNSSFSVEEAYILTQRQDQFGQGYSGSNFDSGENWSWGPAVDGLVRPWTSAIDADGDGTVEALSRPYSAVDDQLANFFNTGHTLSNSVSLSGAVNDFTYYASYSNVDQDGIMDNTYYKRNTITFNSTAKLSEKLSSSYKVSYSNVNQNTAQEGSRAFEGNNAYAMVLQSPITIPFNEVRDYNSPYHDIDGYWGSYSSVNPYYILNEFSNEASIDNFLGNASITYNILDDLSVTGRFGANVVNTKVETITPTFTPAEQLVWGDNLAITTRNSRHNSLGEYVVFDRNTVNLDFSAMANYSTTINQDFTLNVAGGYNFFQRERTDITGSTQGGLVVEDVYNLANSALAPLADSYTEKYRLWGLLANANIGFRNYAFLEYSIRRDVSSTLPEANNAFSYQAVGASVVLSDMLDIDTDAINFIKLRGSIGTSGKDADLFLLNSDFIGNPTIANLGDFALNFPLNGEAGFTVSNQIGSPDLRPELTTTYEFGADVGLFGERLNVAYTYYVSKHEDQIVEISLPRSTGFTITASNIGGMENRGHELSLGLKPIYGLVDGLDLELFGTYSKNVNEVTKISDQTDELSIGAYTPGVTIVAKEGLPFGTYKALDYKTNDNGQVIVDSNGEPLKTDEEQYLGSYQPDYLMSFGANMNYKGLGFNILFDLREGGSFVSQTMFFTEFNGTSVHTAEYGREAFVWPNSVIELEDGSFEPNTTEITEESFYTNGDPAEASYIIDASFLKLREIGLSYTFPSKVLGKTPIESARLALFAKNVKFWLPEENTFSDPEINGPGQTGNAQGIETSQTPTNRSFGVSLQVTF